MANPLAGDIKVPVLGTFPKPVVFGGLAVTGYLIYRSRTKSASAPGAGTPGADPYPSDGTIGNPSDLNSVDPQTGVTYGDEQVGYGGNQIQPGIQNAGDAYPWDGTYNNPNDPYSMDSSSGQTYGNEGFGGGGGGGGQNGPPFSTNQQWADYAEQQLSSTADPGQLAQALGLYLAGQKVTTAQEALIYEAQGVAGMPPVTGKNAMPPGINVQGSKQGGGGGGGGGSTPASNPVKGLTAHARQTEADLSWQHALNAKDYSIRVFHDRQEEQHVTVSGTSTTLKGLKKKTRYTVRVLAEPAKANAGRAQVAFTTK